jgi:hypothetical protein
MALLLGSFRWCFDRDVEGEGSAAGARCQQM